MPLAVLLEGKNCAQQIKDSVKNGIDVLYQREKVRPRLSCVCVGVNPAVNVYLRSQAKIAGEVGINHQIVSLPSDISKEDFIVEVHKLNTDAGVHAIMVQTPLPKGFNLDEIMSFISSGKDAESMHPENLGKLLLGENRIAPCTAAACMELLRCCQFKLYGKEVVIVGHSNIVGKPLSLMMLKEFATTTVCHIATTQAHQLTEHIARAEVLVVAVGKPHLIKGAWIKEGAAVIDVGINRLGQSIVGDVEFDEAQKRAAYITPVPGGVGPLTVAILMRNVFELFKEQLELKL